MTNLKKWQQKIAKAKDGEDFLYQIGRMYIEHDKKYCREMRVYCHDPSKCHACHVKWLDAEVKK